jgi:hypothetical protein
MWSAARRISKVSYHALTRSARAPRRARLLPRPHSWLLHRRLTLPPMVANWMLFSRSGPVSKMRPSPRATSASLCTWPWPCLILSCPSGLVRDSQCRAAREGAEPTSGKSLPVSRSSASGAAPACGAAPLRHVGARFLFRPLRAGHRALDHEISHKAVVIVSPLGRHSIATPVW